MAAINLNDIRIAASSELITCSGSPIDGDVSSWDPDFHDQWRRANSIVGAAFRATPPSADAQSDADALRSTIFSFVMAKTGDEALAAYTGDDFHFIVNSAILGVDDPWISALWDTYRNGRSPYIAT